MRTRKKIILLLLVLILIVNTSIVYSSLIDRSRYETGGYSFKIPEGFHHALGPGTDDNEYLVDEKGGYTDYGSNRIFIGTTNENLDLESKNNFTLLLKLNETTSFYTAKLKPWVSNQDLRNMTIGIHKTNNGTTIIIYLQNSLNVEYDNHKVESDIDIIKGMFDSVKKD